MDQRAVMTSGAKVILTLGAIVAFFSFAVHRAPLMAVSPDSVRFMHFAQINADRMKASDGVVVRTVKLAFNTLRSTNAYDVSRGRFTQGTAYALDAFIRAHLRTVALNLLMGLVLALNAGLVAWLVARSVVDPGMRMNVFCLGWLALLTTSMMISPFLLLILYAKYLWITFLLCYFIFPGPVARGCALALTAASDEIGLFSAMILVFMEVVRFMLRVPLSDRSAAPVSARILARAIALGGLVSFGLMFAFYGISAVIFQVPAAGFKLFAMRGTEVVLKEASLFWQIIQSIAWQAEVIAFGQSFGNAVLTIVVGLSAAGMIITALVLTIRKRLATTTEGLLNRIFAALSDQEVFFFLFWFFACVLIVWLILPGGAGDITHHGYPAYAVISLLALKSLVDLLAPRRAMIVLVTVLLLHIALLPRAVDTTSAFLQRYLLTDGTVSLADLRAIDRSVNELKATGQSPTFLAINNGQEIDFSGTWFYSRVKGYGPAAGGPYFPVQGTVRVLAWPHRVPARCVNRVFNYKGPSFEDIPCPPK